MPEMKVGSLYRNRGGTAPWWAYKVLHGKHHGTVFALHPEYGEITLFPNGRYYADREDPRDLVEEIFTAPPTTTDQRLDAEFARLRGLTSGATIIPESPVTAKYDELNKLANLLDPATSRGIETTAEYRMRLAGKAIRALLAGETLADFRKRAESEDE